MGLLSGKVAIITGGSRGIGDSIVEEYVKNGAIVYAISRSKGSMDENSAIYNAKYEGTVNTAYFDIRDENSAKETFRNIYKEHNRIDILVNNAGIMQDALIGMITNKMIEESFSVNVFSLINLTQLVSRFMVKNGAGSIINISSIVGTNGNAGQSLYSASKGAVISFTKSAAKELSPKGIRVNAIAPGIIKTDLLDNVPKELLQKRIENIKMGRIGNPIDVASVAVFLASDLSAYVSGQIISVDGCTII